MWCIELECIEMAIIHHWNKIHIFNTPVDGMWFSLKTLREKMEKMGQPRAPKVREDHGFPSCELQGSPDTALPGWLFYKTNLWLFVGPIITIL